MTNQTPLPKIAKGKENIFSLIVLADKSPSWLAQWKSWQQDQEAEGITSFTTRTNQRENYK